MERIIIIASPEIDVSEAVKILKSDEVEISVVAPSPANFLHLALGMIPDHPNDGQLNTENDEEESKNPDESEDGDQESAEEAPKPEEEITPEEEPVKEEGQQMPQSIGECIVNGERVSAFITTGKPYIEVQNLTIGLRNNFKINESSFSFWNTTNENELHHVFYISNGPNVISSLLEVKTSDATQPRLFLTVEQAASLK